MLIDASGSSSGVVMLRDLEDQDLPILFEHQRDPIANEMAAFPPRERDAFMEHWAKILADDGVTKKTILFNGRVAGSIVCWENSGRRLVGYCEIVGVKALRRGRCPASSRLSEPVRCMRTQPRVTSLQFGSSRNAGSWYQARTNHPPATAAGSSRNSSTYWGRDPFLLSSHASTGGLTFLKAPESVIPLLPVADQPANSLRRAAFYAAIPRPIGAWRRRQDTRFHPALCRLMNGCAPASAPSSPSPAPLGLRMTNVGTRGWPGRNSSS
jgi:hypothetical protein